MKQTQYVYTYGVYRASVVFLVTEKFKAEDAKLLLEFFSWDYDEEANPIDELMKKYAITAIEVATAENLNEYGVKCWFEKSEGFLALDGSAGIELKLVESYDFDEDDLSLEKTIS